MNTTSDSAIEQLTIELPVSVVSAIRAEAEAQGRNAESIAADRLANFYAVAANEPPSTSPFGTPDDIYAALYGPAHRFDPVAIRKKYQEKYGTPDLSHLSKEELIEKAEETIAQMEPSKRAEMERLGLL